MRTLILAGHADRIVLPRLSVQFKQYIPQAEFVMFEKSGHNPYIEETEKMFEILRSFLAK
jgi:proline iminopeptidase